MAEGWQRKFYDPIPLPDGRRLVTLKDVGEYIQALPAALQKREDWQAATHALLLVVDGNGDPMLARIGVMLALNAKKAPAAPIPRGRRSVRKMKILR